MRNNLMIGNNEIEKTVAEILKSCDYKETGYVDVLKIAQDLGFLVGNSNLPDTQDGFIIVNDKSNIEGFGTNKIIGVRSNLTYEMKRFIIAHELGHYFFKPANEEMFAHREHRIGKNDEENEFDYFSACLLLPKDLFDSTYEKLNKDGINENFLISQMANEMKVPALCVSRRFGELGYKDKN